MLTSQAKAASLAATIDEKANRIRNALPVDKGYMTLVMSKQQSTDGMATQNETSKQQSAIMQQLTSYYQVK